MLKAWNRNADGIVFYPHDYFELQYPQLYKSAKYSIPKPLGLWEEQENMNIAAVLRKNIFQKPKRSK
jgi:hypothetical protein